MSTTYQLGQLIKHNKISYISSIGLGKGDKNTNFIFQNLESEKVTFTDISLQPVKEDSSSGVTEVLKLDSNTTYYLSFEVDRMVVNNDEMIDFSFDVLLANQDNEIEQYIRTIKIERGNNKAFVNLIFTPNDNYDIIVLDIARTQQDFIKNKTKKMTISNYKLFKIENILPENINIEKIGIQAPSGMMFTINGEEMMIGRTGIYELYNKDIPITYLGFVTEQNDNKFFIVDYQYK